MGPKIGEQEAALRVCVWMMGCVFAELAWAQTAPDLVIITVDALRRDRLSCEGYDRRTSPEIDQLLAKGVRFSNARTIEPLTTPALTSMITSVYPHQHGATRNGVRAFSDLVSLPGVLEEVGYESAAFVGSWVLKDRLSNLGGYFTEFHEVLTRKRWFGLLKGEASARDLTERAQTWLASRSRYQPFLLWVHYIEPHAPYKWHEEFADSLEYGGESNPNRSQRYDSEIAFVDREIGRLLKLVREASDNVLIVFSADHGESLGEHDYWGHGRHLFEPSLIIPLGYVWEGVIFPAVVQEPCSILDVAPTVLGLMDFHVPPSFRGVNWSSRILGQEDPPTGGPVFLQAHKGAVQSRNAAQRKRKRGLLQVGVVSRGVKQIVDLRDERVETYRLESDPLELAPDFSAEQTPILKAWLKEVLHGLDAGLDQEPPQDLGAEDLQALESLGYLK